MLILGYKEPFSAKELSTKFVEDSNNPLSVRLVNDVKLGQGLADFGKNLEGWFFDFKLHLIITENMEIVSFKFSPASTSDISTLDDKMVAGLQGFLIDDKGYISSSKASHFSKKVLL